MSSTRTCYAIQYIATGELRRNFGNGGPFESLICKGEPPNSKGIVGLCNNTKLFVNKETAQHVILSTLKVESARYNYTPQEYSSLFRVVALQVSAERYDDVLNKGITLAARNARRSKITRANKKKVALAEKDEAIALTTATIADNAPAKCGPKPNERFPVGVEVDEAIVGEVTVSLIFNASVVTDIGRITVKRYRSPQAAFIALAKQVDKSYYNSIKVIPELTTTYKEVE